MTQLTKIEKKALNLIKKITKSKLSEKNLLNKNYKDIPFWDSLVTLKVLIQLKKIFKKDIPFDIFLKSKNFKDIFVKIKKNME
jgi:acyl carrier protein